MNSLLITKFLRKTLQNKDFIVISFIFGSVVKGKKIPNDCDLFVVTNQTPFLKDWSSFITEMEELKIDFELIFSLKLNIIINTEKEFLEYSPFKERILNKPIIEIR